MTVSIILTTYTRNGFKKLQCERTFLLCQTSLVLKKDKCLSDENILVLTRFRMGIFGVAHGRWGAKRTSPPKSCDTYPTMMKLGTVIAYLQKIQTNMNHVMHPLSSADISIFSQEISKFCYIKK